MGSTIRFPLMESSQEGPGLHEERDQIIVLSSAVISLPLGGVTPYPSILPWKKNVATTEAPYCDIVIEFQGVDTMTIGDGTLAEMIGLFGRINTPGDATLDLGQGMYLLGVLGISLGNDFPQIPIINSIIGYAQIIKEVAVYDALAVGGINGDIALAEELTIRVRPIRQRDTAG